MCEKTTRKQPESKIKKLEAEIVRLRHVEAELKRSLQFTESLLSAVPIPVFFKDAEGRYLGCNKAFTDMIGVIPEEIKGKKVYELWPSEHAKMYHQKDLEVMHNLEHQTYEYVVKDKNGADRSVIGLNNICRHAEAQHVRIRLVAAYPNIILRMEDDGKGFEIERRMRETILEKRMGLISMRE